MRSWEKSCKIAVTVVAGSYVLASLGERTGRAAIQDRLDLSVSRPQLQVYRTVRTAVRPVGPISHAVRSLSVNQTPRSDTPGLDVSKDFIDGLVGQDILQRVGKEPVLSGASRQVIGGSVF